MIKLGDILTGRGWISQDMLAKALRLQEKQSGKLGDTLVALGAIGLRQLHQALADQHGLRYVNLMDEPPESTLLHQMLSPELCLSRRLVPWRRHEDGGLIIAVTDPSEETRKWCRKQFGSLTHLVMTSPMDIRLILQRECGLQLEQASILSLWQRHPLLSSRNVWWPAQQRWFAALGLMIALCLLIAPWQTLVALMVIFNLLFFATLLFKSIIFLSGLRSQPTLNWQQILADLDEASLPVYTILVPMYREKESLPGMLKSLAALDYPVSRLDIKLVLEADDEETYRAACALKPPYHIDIIRVPASHPRTKPKACNYALRFARGEYITIYDADDRPEPTQLKKAVAMFRRLPPEVVCLQARLNYYNAGDNLLTRFFCLEYAMLFGTLMPGLQRLGIPMPLGGTSNHLALAKLRALGEWDPFNVTEDADLGTRLCLEGGKTEMLDSFTLEEAPIHVMPWIRQRGRWIKGYMQTWLVYMRAPIMLYQSLGLAGFLGFQFFMGLSCLTFLVAPLVWLVSLLWLTGSVLHHLPEWLIMLAVVNLAFNILSHWIMAAASLIHQHHSKFRLLSGVLFFPLYLALHSLASYRALWQLFVAPHLWDKTEHGLSQPSALNISENEALKVRVAA